jgi:hypothetical protein
VIDYAHLLKAGVDDFDPEAIQIVVVQDNLNTNSPASLYKAFEPEEARRILENSRKTRILLYTQAWQLARHGQN